jgi:hypothetical protein
LDQKTKQEFDEFSNQLFKIFFQLFNDVGNLVHFLDLIDKSSDAVGCDKMETGY